MTPERQRELIEKQIADAKEGHPDDFDQWHSECEIVLRSTVGTNSPSYERFQKIRYSPSVMYAGMDTSGYRPAGVRKAISLFESIKLELDLATEVEQVVTTTPGAPQAEAGKRIFIVHGHDEAMKEKVARFLSKLTGTEPTILHEQPNGGKLLMEKFEHHAGEAGYAVVLATADDLGRAKDEADLCARGRQNVIFEMGFFFGAFGRSRTIVLHEEGVELPGDIDGLVYTAIDARGAWRPDLARELEAADIEVDWSALGR